MIYSLFKELKIFFLKKEKGVFFFLVLAFIGLWFLIEPVDSLKILLRIFAVLLFLTGFMEYREFAYDPTLKSYYQQKKIKSVLFMVLGVLIAFVPLFLVDWTGSLLGLFFIGLAALKLIELKKYHFDFASMIKTSTGQYYLILLVLGVVLFFNTFFFKLAISYFLGIVSLLIALRGLMSYFSKTQK